MTLLLVNLKTYNEGTGPGAVSLSDAARTIAGETGVDIAIAAQPTDIRVLSTLGVSIFSQHVDPVEFGSNTGHITPQAVKEAGARGTLINHAERKLSLDTIQRTIELCKKAGLKTAVCTDNLEEAGKIAAWKPDYIAFEDPELIGTGKPISQSRSADVKEFAELMARKGVTPLCGAGISTAEDAKASMELGTQGVLVASAIVKSGVPVTVIREIAEAMK